MYHFELRPNRMHSIWNNELEKFFDTFSKEDHFAPSCEIQEQEKFYSISLDVPGISKEEIDIEVKDNLLTISGERKFTENTKEHVLKSERRYGKFFRTFTLPKNINSESIEARFENGVLELVLPKEEKSLSRKITIGEKSMVNASLS